MSTRLALILLLFPGVADAQTARDPVRRGPSEIRDEHVLAQTRLTLPAVSTAITPRGQWSLSLRTGAVGPARRDRRLVGRRDYCLS